MGHVGELVLGLMIAVSALSVLARVIRVPYPVLLVLGGLGLGFVPGLPEVELDPDLVLVIVLPPLLYAAAFFSSLRDLKANLRPISTLAVGLVVLTTCVVAVVAHTLIDGLPWASAFVLGAVVAPTDPLAATEIASRLGVPRRIVTIVEGEALINDGHRAHRLQGGRGRRGRRRLLGLGTRAASSCSTRSAGSEWASSRAS